MYIYTYYINSSDLANILKIVVNIQRGLVQMKTHLFEIEIF